MNNPKVSIIVPCFNQAQYLDEALQSVLNQTYSNWECLIIDDGSPDNTAEIARKWQTHDNRFIYIHKANGGVSSARNLGIEKAKGEYIQFLDSDDFLEKEKLELSLQEIEKNNEVNLVVSNFRMFTTDINKSTKPFCQLQPHFFTFKSMLYDWNEHFSIQVQCGFFHYSLFETIRFPENLTAQEDWIVWVKVFKEDCKVVFVDKPLALYRTNPSSRMNKSIYEDQIQAYNYFKNFLNADEFHALSIRLISRYYLSNEECQKRWIKVKKSNSYQTGLMVKKFLKTLGLLKLFKKLFPFLLKLKAK